MNPSQKAVLWENRCRKERAFVKYDKTPAELEDARKGSDLRALKSMRARLEEVSADYVWGFEGGSSAAAGEAGGASSESAMAQLARGVPTVETQFMRGMRPSPNKKAAYVRQVPSVYPWQLSGVDPCFVPLDALEQWKTKTTVLTMPAVTPPPPRAHATIVGRHAGSVDAWQHSQAPLSQWEASARSENLVLTNKSAERHAAAESRAQLAKLLKVTSKTSQWRDWIVR